MDLCRLAGVGPKTKQALVQAGIVHVEDLAALTPSQLDTLLVKIGGVTAATQQDARDLV